MIDYESQVTPRFDIHLTYTPKQLADYLAMIVAQECGCTIAWNQHDKTREPIREISFEQYEAISLQILRLVQRQTRKIAMSTNLRGTEIGCEAEN